MISICIPTKDAGPEFCQALELWKAQRVPEELELVVVDSGSSDATVAQARDGGARVLSIPPETFNHGETRNLLARQARGELLVFTVQDALPVDSHVVSELTEPLRQVAALAGVTGKQVPRPAADFLGRWEVERHAQNVDRGRRVKQLDSWEQFLSWDFFRRFECVAFDNVCSAIRRSAWERQPFARIDFGEDLDWAVRVLRRGGAILHNPSAKVAHAHRRGPLAWLRRYFVGRRRTSHILHMPPQYSGLDDASAFRTVGEFDAWVADFAATGWKRKLLPSMAASLDQLMPSWLLASLRRMGHQGPTYVNTIRPPTRLWLNFSRLWGQGMRFNGSVPVAEAAQVARQLEALIVGDFFGSYYHSCEVENRVSPQLEQLGRWLATAAGHNNASARDGLAAFFSRWPAS